MPLFQYKAAAPSGEVVEGEMEAANRETVVRHLQAQGRIPIRAEEASASVAAVPGSEPAKRWFAGRFGHRELMLVTLDLATLLESGVQVDRALDMLVRIATPGPVRDVLADVHRAVRAGSDLSSALEAHPRIFSTFYRNMVQAGESSGALDAALTRLGDHLARARAVRDALVTTLIYPAVLFFVAVVSLSVILGFVVPRISEMFVDAGQTLPLATRIVVALGDAVAGYWWAGIALTVGGFVLARAQLQRREVRVAADRLLLDLPGLGNLFSRVETARFTRTLGTLLTNGVPLLKALSIASATVRNTVVSDALASVRRQVRAGGNLTAALTDTGVFPVLACHLLQVGEETGGLEKMLLRVAEIYEREVETTIRRLVGFIEPALILTLGVAIAAIILSIVIAILQVNQLAF